MKKYILVSTIITYITCQSTVTAKKWKCKDNSSFEFDTEFAGVQDCTWLSEKIDRQEKYCEGKGWENASIKKVKFECRESCAPYLDAFEDKCDEHLDDVYDDDYVDDYDNPDCNNDPDFEFSTEKGEDRDCAWLAEKADRQAKYCETFGWDFDAHMKVKYMCQDACEDYLDEICAKPIDKCVDEDNYEFETEFVGIVDCEWLSEKEERQQKYCETHGYGEEQKKKVKYGCKESCSAYNRCEKSDIPSLLPSISPLAVPSTLPSIAPNVLPSIAPSDDCFDDDDYTFETKFVGTQDCKWLSEKDTRQNRYCNSFGWDGAPPAKKKVKFACRKACAEKKFNGKCS